MSKLFNHKITLSDGTVIVDARSDHRTKDGLNNTAKSTDSDFELWKDIRENPVVKEPEQIGDGYNKETAIIRKKAIIDAFIMQGLKVRNNPKSNGNKWKADFKKMQSIPEFRRDWKERADKDAGLKPYSQETYDEFVARRKKLDLEV